MKVDKDTKFRNFRNDRLSFLEKNEALKRKEATAKKNKVANKLFILGNDWFRNGKKLEDADDIINYDGKDMMLKDNKSFLRGYEAGILKLAFDYGYAETPVENLPKEYVDSKNFMNEYYNGFNKKTSEINKKNGIRR